MGWVNTVDKRELILNAAQNCLKDRGLKGLNIRDVAKEAGVSLGSVHYYFASKEEILVEIFRQFVQRVSEATLSGTPDADPRQVITDLLDGYFDELSKDPATCQGFIDLWDHVPRNEDLRRLMEKYYRRSAEFLTDLIKEGKRQGLFQVDSPSAAAGQIIAIIDGIKVQLHLFGRETDLARMKRATKKFVLNALRAQQPGARNG
jgi:AcrR family transcriptional regulator